MVQAVEAGYTTTEFWLTAITAFLAAVMDLYVAFGGILKPEQRGAVIAIITTAIPLLVAAYAIARSIRKKGTLEVVKPASVSDVKVGVGAPSVSPTSSQL